MGYYKNLEIELEEIQDDELRDIVAWDYAHRHELSSEVRWRILTNEFLLKRAIFEWKHGTPAPVPATQHVSLQQKRPRIRNTRISWQGFAGWCLIFAAFISYTVILVVAL